MINPLSRPNAAVKYPLFHGILVSCGCYNKWLQTWWLKPQKCIILLFCRSDIQQGLHGLNQDAGKTRFQTGGTMESPFPYHPPCLFFFFFWIMPPFLYLQSQQCGISQTLLPSSYLFLTLAGRGSLPSRTHVIRLNLLESFRIMFPSQGLQT